LPNSRWTPKVSLALGTFANSPCRPRPLPFSCSPPPPPHEDPRHPARFDARARWKPYLAIIALPSTVFPPSVCPPSSCRRRGSFNCPSMQSAEVMQPKCFLRSLALFPPTPSSLAPPQPDTAVFRHFLPYSFPLSPPHGTRPNSGPALSGQVSCVLRAFFSSTPF